MEGQVGHQHWTLSVDMVNDLDAILELPNDALVTWVGQELQRVVEWGVTMLILALS